MGMQLTFFIGQKIKCPGQSIYLNHTGVFSCLSKRKLTLMLLQPALMKETDRETIPDSTPVPAFSVQCGGVDKESDAANSCWGSILSLRSFLPQPRVYGP